MSRQHSKARKPAPRRPSFGRQTTLSPRVRGAEQVLSRSTPGRGLSFDGILHWIAWVWAGWAI
jgi:hypothetical protein